MTGLLEKLLAATLGAAIAVVAARRFLGSPPAWSLRVNVSGTTVPAVLGLAVIAGGASGMGAAAVAGRDDPGYAVVWAALIVFVLLGAAGRWDDERGDESPRGFAGHLGARRLTGGIVKIAAGGLAGIAAGAIVYPDGPLQAVLTALAVPLAANLFNLLDRAPGRTGKVALLFGLPLLAAGHPQWVLAAAGPLGALVAVLPADLDERGMLGDAGANPLGALVGLGLAVSLDVVPLTAVVLVLLALNAASERWSFSDVIARTPPLRAFDSIGRK
ncbi:MAG TPA: hypothetical protein VHI71_02670 [Actinomycetota bacterium]|nr:hypothetical protein [Actinomycetota bacterium]